MLRALAEPDECNVRLLARGDRSYLGHVDLRSEHLVAEVRDQLGDMCKAILALVRDEHSKTNHLWVISGRAQRRKRLTPRAHARCPLRALKLRPGAGTPGPAQPGVRLKRSTMVRRC